MGLSRTDRWRKHGGLDPGESEYDLCEHAEERLGETDSALAGRVEFAPESYGTGLSAVARKDIERALDLLGLN